MVLKVSCEGYAQLHIRRDDDAVDESRQAGQPSAVRQPLKGAREVGSRPGVGEALAQPARRLALREPTHPLKCPGGAITGRRAWVLLDVPTDGRVWSR